LILKQNRPLPPTAQSAESEAKIIAKNLYAVIINKEKEKFVYSPRSNGSNRKTECNCKHVWHSFTWNFCMDIMKSNLSFKNPLTR